MRRRARRQNGAAATGQPEVMAPAAMQSVPCTRAAPGFVPRWIKGLIQLGHAVAWLQQEQPCILTPLSCFL